jgi:hypothetical protein
METTPGLTDCSRFFESKVDLFKGGFTFPHRQFRFNPTGFFGKIIDVQILV